MSSKYERGKPAPKTVWMTPEQLVNAAEIWRDFERQAVAVAELVIAGKTDVEIARELHWDIRSVRHILNPIRRYLRDVVGNKEQTSRRLYRKAQ